MDSELDSQLLLRTAQEFGTPLYVYNADSISEQYKKLTNAFKGGNTTFFYACKALTNINVLKHVKGLGANIDCSSINEIHLAIMAGFIPDQIIFTSNGVRFEELVESVSIGVHVNIDNLSTLKKFGKKYSNSYPASVRLRPNIMAGGNINIATGHENSKFGIPIEQIDDIIAIMNEFSININGLHIHSGSDINDLGVYIREVEVMMEFMAKFPDIEFIDLGGGLKVPYDLHDQETDINQLSLRLTALFSKYKRKNGEPYQIWFEPGKFLVSKCGYLIARVNVIHDTAAATFVCLDTGFNHLIRPMLYGAYHRIGNLSNENDDKLPYHIVGNLCETDTFAENRMLPKISEGDYLVFYNAGAYGFEMSMNYNARFKPAEVLIEGDKARLIRRRDVLEDILKNQVTI